MTGPVIGPVIGPGAAYLDADFVVRRGDFVLDVALSAEPGDVIAVIGPNGSGKSTMARALAGLVPVTSGRITCRGTDWDTGEGQPVQVQARNVGVVFQDLLLFPHLSALDNVAFGPHSRGVDKTGARRTARAWLDRLGVGELSHRRPGELSGGQAQRVAIARALATEPALLLLDEPLAALDVGVAMTLRVELARHLADFGGVSVLVTHQAIDTMTVANRVMVLDEGSVAQIGSPQEVAQRPRTDHVARLVGLNALRGRSSGTDVQVTDAMSLTSVTPFDGEVFASFTPSAVTVTLEEPTGSARNRWQATVQSVVPHGEAVRVHLDAGQALIADVTPASVARLSLVPGRAVWASVKATEVAIYGTTPSGPDARLPSRHV